MMMDGKTLSVRLSDDDARVLDRLREELQTRTNLRVTKGGMIRYMLRTYATQHARDTNNDAGK